MYEPYGGVSDKDRKANEDAHDKLVRGAFLRQAHVGIYHLLPLGYRVQDKIMKVIEKHMGSIGASRMALATLSSPSAWGQSGRFDKLHSELFVIEDRKGKPLLLSPTHEEEITIVVRQTLSSHKQLPARLYQITSKFRDEIRPRKGLLRGREFMMKDLYTFDLSLNSALETYHQVRAAYDKIFAELRLPVLVAEASSGDIGGDLSHEYHLATPEGEDDVVSCTDCQYMANTEVVVGRLQNKTEPDGAIPDQGVRVWRATTKDKKTLVNVWYSASSDVELAATPTHPRKWDDVVNFHAVKRIVPDLDPNVENVELTWWNSVLANCSKADSPATTNTRNTMAVINLVDGRLSGLKDTQAVYDEIELSSLPFAAEAYSKFNMPLAATITEGQDGEPLNLIKVRNGDACPKCDSGTLLLRKATELGHTFHLGVRYSDPMGLTVKLPSSPERKSGNDAYMFSSKRPTEVNVQMGCHGIGVSRIISAMAEHFSDDNGLNWPRVIAPYEVAIITNKQMALEDAEKVYDHLAGHDNGEGRATPTTMAAMDLVLDDRERSLPWKLKDADLVGYPVLVVLGKAWAESRQCEVQCRQLGYKELIAFDDLKGVVGELLGQI